MLHFDINNTILVADPVAGVKLPAAVNTYVAGIIWGREEEDGSFQWSSTITGNHAPGAGLVTYYKYLEAKMEREGRSRKEFKATLARFSETPEGEPGKLWVDRIIEALTCTYEHYMEPFVFDSDGTMYYYILPSFWRLLAFLQEDGRDFSVVLRTFGTDGPKIQQAINEFADGQHPEYPDGCPAAMSAHPHPQLRLAREGDAGFRLEDTAPPEMDPLPFVPKVSEVEPGQSAPMMRAMETMAAHAPAPKKKPGSAAVADGECEVFQFLDQTTGTTAIRDDYPYWKLNGFLASAGKPMWIPAALPGDGAEPAPLHILFDDNIRVDSPDNSIVDTRMLALGSDSDLYTSYAWEAQGPCCPEEAEAAGCLVPAALHRSALEPDYFIEQVRSCESRWEHWLSARAPAPRRGFARRLCWCVD